MRTPKQLHSTNLFKPIQQPSTLAAPNVVGKRNGFVAHLGKTIDAIKFFKKSIELNESYADPHYNLGHIYQSDDKYDEAITCYKNAIEINPKYYAAYNNLGNIYKEIGDLDAAIGSFKKAINLKPKF